MQFGRWEYLLQLLIVISLVDFAVETIQDLPAFWMEVLGVVEIVTVLIFTAEYFTRLALARPRAGYAFSFFGIVDLVSILPFYLATGIDLGSLRSPACCASSAC